MEKLKEVVMVTVLIILVVIFFINYKISSWPPNNMAGLLGGLIFFIMAVTLKVTIDFSSSSWIFLIDPYRPIGLITNIIFYAFIGVMAASYVRKTDK